MVDDMGKTKYMFPIYEHDELYQKAQFVYQT